MRDMYKKTINPNRWEYIAVYRDCDDKQYFNGKEFICDNTYKKLDYHEYEELVELYKGYRLYSEDGMNRISYGYVPLKKELEALNIVFEKNMLNEEGQARLSIIEDIIDKGIEEYYGTKDYDDFKEYVDYTYNYQILEDTKDKSFDRYYSELYSHNNKCIANITFHKTAYDFFAFYCYNDETF